MMRWWEVSMTQKKLISIKRNSLNLALHHWSAEKSKAILFYINGIQSHAGWLFETAPMFAKNGIDVFVLDRRGTGLSEGLRGDISSKETLFGDYVYALEYIKNISPDNKITLLGQSLGGSILAGLLSWPEFNISYDKIIFCASALGKRHYQLSQKKLEQTLADQSLDEVPIPIKDTDYTKEKRYLDFIKNDPLCYKKITKRSISTLVDIEKLYLAKPGILHQKSAVYLCPAVDPVVNLQQSLKVFNALTDYNGIVKRFPTHNHYLWFTAQHNDVVQWVSDFVLQGSPAC